MDFDQPITKILFIDNDETSFQFRKCMAKVLNSLPPIELFHAVDATEALGMLETLQPDVIVIDGELAEEKELFLDSLSSEHPPIVLQTNESTDERNSDQFETSNHITKMEKNESVDGIHQTLRLASELGTKALEAKNITRFH